MLLFVVFWILLLTIWGLAGVHTDKIGFKHVGEIWAYQAFYGLLVCPWYAYSQTMIAEVSPLPQMCVGIVAHRCRFLMLDDRYLFFALFSVIGKTSAFIGPFVSEAIITASGNNNKLRKRPPLKLKLSDGPISPPMLSPTSPTSADEGSNRGTHSRGFLSRLLGRGGGAPA